MTKRTSLETIIQKCKEWNVICLEKSYINNKTKMKFQCNCGEIFERRWDGMIKKDSSKQCEKCNGRIMWDIDKIYDKCKQAGITCLETEYKSISRNMKFQCRCGNVFERRWSDIFKRKKYLCVSCMNNNVVWTLELIKIQCKKKNIKCLSDKYHNTNTPMKFQCNCGEIFERRWGDILRRDKYKCQKCLGRIYWDINSIKKECKNLDLICISDSYNTSQDKLKFKCKCGSEFERSWRAIIGQNQTLCNKCANILSKGERLILKYLESNNYSFKTQYKITDCRNIKPLPFDFAIFENNKLKIIIEYDGEQHYTPKFNNSQKEFLKIQERDKIKTQYCLDNNIPLLRIPYWDLENVIEILDKTLKNK